VTSSASGRSGTKTFRSTGICSTPDRFHRGLQRFVEDLNQLYSGEAALWESDYDYAGFFWIDCGDAESSVLSFVRQTQDGKSQLAVILNLTPVLRTNYRIGLPRGGFWREAMNSDSEIYGGSNQGNLGGVTAEDYRVHHQPFSAAITLPPMGVVVLGAKG